MDVPESEMCELGQVADVAYGCTVNKQRREADEKIPYLRVANVKPGRLDLSDVKYIGVIGDDVHRYRLQANDLLVVEGNGNPELLGAACMWRAELPLATHQNHLIRVRAKANVVLPEWIFHIFGSRYVREQILGAAKTSSGLYTINSQVVKQLRLWVPPLPEQRKIAAILSSVDEAIEKTQAVIDQVQVVKKGLMQELLTKGLPGRHQKFKQTEIGTIPESWEVVDLDDLIDQQRPICYGILKPGTGVPNGVPVVKVKDIKNGRVLDTELLLTSPDIDQQYRRSRLRAGDLLLTIRGTPGRLAVVPASLENANITQDTARIAVLPNHSSAYVRRVLESPGLQAQIEHNTVGQAVKGINIGAVRKLRIPLPGFHEQSVIADAINCIDIACDANVRELMGLRTLKTALMQSLLTGQLRVTP